MKEETKRMRKKEEEERRQTGQAGGGDASDGGGPAAGRTDRLTRPRRSSPIFLCVRRERGKVMIKKGR